MKHWRLEDVAWDRFDPARADPELIPLVKAAAMVERNGTDYAIYLNRVFGDDPDFRQAADALGRGGGAARRRPRQMGDARGPDLGLPGRLRPLQGGLSSCRSMPRPRSAVRAPAN